MNNETTSASVQEAKRCPIALLVDDGNFRSPGCSCDKYGRIFPIPVIVLKYVTSRCDCAVYWKASSETHDTDDLSYPSKMFVVFQFHFVFLFWLVRADYMKTRFHIMKANATSSTPIRSYRTEFARSALNCVALCSVDSQCFGVGVEPIETRKVRCYFVNSCVKETAPRMYDFWQKVREVFHPSVP